MLSKRKVQHVGIRLSLAAGKTCMALLVGVATITMVIPGGDVALGQRGTRIGAQAPLFIAINLHPRGFIRSYALGVSGAQQVGVGVVPGETALLWRGSAASVVELIPSRGGQATAICGSHQVGYGDGFGATGTQRHALLWRGSVASVVDLHPTGFENSEALGTSGGQQVGVGSGPATGGPDHALLWRGSLASGVDLHPRGFDFSRALGTSGGQQVGYGNVSRNGKNYHHALLWRGNAASVVDLNPNGFENSEALGTSGGVQVGYGNGPATGAFFSGALYQAYHDHALLWRGSAASVVDLNPPGFISSSAYATNGAEQVGVGDGPAIRDEAHALLWRGSAASVVDLHTFLPPGFVHSVALAIDAAGDVVGLASTMTGPSGDSYAILWKRNVSRSGTFREQNATGC